MNGLPLQPQPPAVDEVEFSLFGTGYGECIVLHLGRADWIVIDSCSDGQDNVPVALTYLRQIGVSPENNVRLVVATHWHDDHIRGISKILDAAPLAKLAISGAFQNKDFKLALSPWMAQSSAIDGKGLGEIAQLGSIISKRTNGLTFASENKLLFERHGPDPVQVRALSPSDPAVASCIARLGTIEPGTFSRRLPRIDENHASVVLSVQVGSRRMLLGGDLECRADRKFGWLAIVDAQKGSDAPKHHLFKIPHHGSSNGHHEEIWAALLDPQPHSALTPMVSGSTNLPTPADRERILEFSEKTFLTMWPRTTKFRYQENKAVEKMMKGTARSLVAIPQSHGHVCMRGKLDAPPSNWTVTCCGKATHLRQMPD